jgi:hypothetical protein
MRENEGGNELGPDPFLQWENLNCWRGLALKGTSLFRLRLPRGQDVAIVTDGCVFVSQPRKFSA